MSLWKKLLVVLPAFVILHLVAVGVFPLIDGLREVWVPGPLDETRLLMAFPAAYAFGAALGLGLQPGSTRVAMAVSLVLSIAGLYAFAGLANSYREGAAALLPVGLAAGLALPVAARAFELDRTVLGSLIMAVVVAGSWWASVPFVDLFRHGLPIGGAPGWAGPYYAQGFFCVLWLPLVLFLATERRRR
ncbi:MAG: hypothetical protein GC201_16645 [Alphaproteobacteria bacterium]|nr:hypothetical protein [Alphaproteobacteria bacterium]